LAVAPCCRTDSCFSFWHGEYSQY